MANRQNEFNELLDKVEAQHVVARLSGVSAEDSKIEGARKVVETMEMAFGADHPKVKQARRLYERAKARAEK
jgi:predicted ABC-type ATPase